MTLNRPEQLYPCILSTSGRQFFLDNIRRRLILNVEVIGLVICSDYLFHL